VKHAVHWFEIPAADMERAKTFYQGAFGIELQEVTLANDLKLAMFPTEGGGVGGALAEHPDFYIPGSEGPLVYLNADPDLQEVLDRIEEQGGKVLVPKTQISEENGHMAVFLDSEGNRIALHSMD
jgi:predicted enzyme related to lactoylglutathione lyase